MRCCNCGAPRCDYTSPFWFHPTKCHHGVPVIRKTPMIITLKERLPELIIVLAHDACFRRDSESRDNGQ